MNLGLSWFKSKKQKELEALKVEGQKLKNKVLEKQLGHDKKVSTIEEVHPKLYTSLKLVNDTLTVVMCDGSMLTKNPATVEDFQAIKDAVDEDDLLIVMSSAEAVKERRIEEGTVKERIAIEKGINHLLKIDDFRFEDDSVFLVGTQRTIPKLLVEEFSKVIGDIFDHNPDEEDIKIAAVKADLRYQALKNFFLWCCLNPRAEVANDLYDFLKRNSFRITKQGFFVALRNVVTVDDSKKKDREDGTSRKKAGLTEFVSNSYQKIKAVWKQSPKKFSVYTGDHFEGYKFIKNERLARKDFQDENYTVLGTIADLYADLPNDEGNRYTDAHTRTFDIRVGQVVNMPMEDCSWSTRDCMEAGLHFTADEIHYVGCGDTSVLILINPMKVVGIGTSKGRCYEYLPIMTVPRVEATTLLHDLDFDTLELDEDYAINELEGLLETAKDGFKAETTKHKFNLPNMSTSDMISIVDSLSKMKDVLSKRVASID